MKVVRWVRGPARGGGVSPVPPHVLRASFEQTMGGAGRPMPAVLCLPIIDWRFRTQRPQHLMRGLGRRGWQVLFVSPDLDPGARDARIEPDPLAENVWNVILPSAGRRDIYRDTLSDSDLQRMVTALEALRRELRLPEVVVVCQLPFWRPLAVRLQQEWGSKLVYDRMDDHAAFDTNAPQMVGEEERLLTGADAVVATSRVLEDSALLHNPKTQRIANGCDWELWSKAVRSSDAASSRGAVIGFFGAISGRFDVELVASLATARPDWRFLLIGSTYGADVAALDACPNVSLVGEKPYEELPAMAASFDVGIIPFVRQPLTDATNPVKFWEMLALGLPIVASPLPELEPYGDLVHLAADHEGWLGAIERALGEGADGEMRARRLELARANSWQLRIDEFEDVLETVFPLVSILIVTWNNAEMTRLCLDSLCRVTRYPRYEVVVVDNGSTDETPAMLRAAEAEMAGLRILLNMENRGFAAASNRATRTAKGDILCFLNNDTVLTDGWLTTLVRALERDPGLGMAGPVTNAIGNEARVHVGYDELTGMPSWAADWVWSHRGEAFEIPMLAFFCTAIRREVWEEVGELDERFGIGTFEDDDYCRRLRDAGYRLECRRDAFVHHWQGASFALLKDGETDALFERNRRAYRAKWRR